MPPLPFLRSLGFISHLGMLLGSRPFLLLRQCARSASLRFTFLRRLDRGNSSESWSYLLLALFSHLCTFAMFEHLGLCTCWLHGPMPGTLCDCRQKRGRLQFKVSKGVAPFGGAGDALARCLTDRVPPLAGSELEGCLLAMGGRCDVHDIVWVLDSRQQGVVRDPEDNFGCSLQRNFWSALITSR